MATRQGDLCTRAVHVRALREDSREVEFTFSTDSIDRYGEIVEQSWRLENYARNPVVLWSHDSCDLPIGHAKDVGVVDGELRGTVVLLTADANPKAEQVFQSIRQGALRTGSVGFIPNELRFEQREGKDVTVLADNELLEFSVTPVPANPDAAMRRRERAMALRDGVDMTDTDQSDAPAVEPEIVLDEPRPEADAPVADEPKADEPAPEELPETQPEPAPVAEPTDVAELRAELEQCKAERDAIQRRAAELEATLTAVAARGNALAEEIAERDLRSLVGKKLTPAEVPGLVELFRVNRALYDQQVKAIRARPDMGLVRTESTIGAAPIPAATHDSDSGEALMRRVRARTGR